RHRYTQGLLASQPTMDNIAKDRSARLPAIPGMVPPLHDLPAGCPFHPRCEAASELCISRVPELTGEDRRVACWQPVDGCAS
ncbi:MAG: ABC transporter ATP-binding protein, partial [Rhodobacteraceae bacterium]|nr:ABC transporter ATP-binding protein [Paracoccaceae bacterium]